MFALPICLVMVWYSVLEAAYRTSHGCTPHHTEKAHKAHMLPQRRKGVLELNPPSFLGGMPGVFIPTQASAGENLPCR